jgi:hypothetical protein
MAIVCDHWGSKLAFCFRCAGCQEKRCQRHAGSLVKRSITNQLSIIADGRIQTNV